MSNSGHISQIDNLTQIRAEFPILHQQVNGKPLVYFDNAASNQKPLSVLNALDHYYRNDHANIHRGIHTLAERATEAYELSRKRTAEFINAAEPEEIIFTSGTTEGLNLVASTYGRKLLKPGDEVLITNMEHHSNIVPWQMLCEEKDLKLKVLPLRDNGEVKWELLDSMLTERTRIVSIVHASNSLGTINPISELSDKVHQAGAILVVDGAQASAHLEIDVQALNCDFYALSSHKMYGPTGVGVLYGKRKWLEKMPPYKGGGEMIKEVTLEKTTYSDIPHKFEAGTPNIADVVAFKTAIEFIDEIGKNTIIQHENKLLNHAHAELEAIDGLRLIGTAAEKVGVVSFVVDGVHHFDLGVMLDTKGIAVRTGHHCTQPLMECYGLEGTVRASFSVYNTIEEVDLLVESLDAIVKKLRN
ncbi:MAG: cysteine desulfurase [Cyclobacteriaceae bacterium]|nr:MAG: cysteine desulfurase [Cyclobacteriaceae bacterium]